MRILLTGRNGQVGWELERALKAFGDVVALDRKGFDLSDVSSVKKILEKEKPQVIVNAAAYTAVDRAESESELAMQVNGVAPGILAGEAKRLGALLVHYSTDYVFDGEKRTPYTEEDSPRPASAYGRSKLEGDRRIVASGCRHLILRSSWVYAPRGKNFFLTIASKAKAGEALRVVADQHGVPTEAKFIAEMTVALVHARAEGLFNVVPAGATTWHGFAAQIAQRLGAKAPAAITTAEYPTPARRPHYSVLDCTKLATRLGVPPPGWEALLDRCLKAWTPA